MANITASVHPAATFTSATLAAQANIDTTLTLAKGTWTATTPTGNIPVQLLHAKKVAGSDGYHIPAAAPQQIPAIAGAASIDGGTILTMGPVQPPEDRTFQLPHNSGSASSLQFLHSTQEVGTIPHYLRDLEVRRGLKFNTRQLKNSNLSSPNMTVDAPELQVLEDLAIDTRRRHEIAVSEPAVGVAHDDHLLASTLKWQASTATTEISPAKQSTSANPSKSAFNENSTLTTALLELYQQEIGSHTTYAGLETIANSSHLLVYTNGNTQVERFQIQGAELGALCIFAGTEPEKQPEPTRPGEKVKAPGSRAAKVVYTSLGTPMAQYTSAAHQFAGVASQTRGICNICGWTHDVPFHPGAQGKDCAAQLTSCPLIRTMAQVQGYWLMTLLLAHAQVAAQKNFEVPHLLDHRITLQRSWPSPVSGALLTAGQFYAITQLIPTGLIQTNMKAADQLKKENWEKPLEYLQGEPDIAFQLVDRLDGQLRCGQLTAADLQTILTAMETKPGYTIGSTTVAPHPHYVKAGGNAPCVISNGNLGVATGGGPSTSPITVLLRNKLRGGTASR